MKRDIGHAWPEGGSLGDGGSQIIRQWTDGDG
jgi:hypothetical protein